MQGFQKRHAVSPQVIDGIYFQYGLKLFVIFENMKRKTQIIGKLIRQRIDMIDPDAEIILYGSRARGDERSDSDWDIIVLTDYPADLEKEQVFRNQLYDLELETGESLSVFVYSKNDWETRQRITPFYQNVIHEGIQL